MMHTTLTSGASSMARLKSRTASRGRPCDRCTLPRLLCALALSGSCCSTIWKKRAASSQRCSVAALTPACMHAVLSTLCMDRTSHQLIN
jgi:hypothetical protein